MNPKPLPFPSRDRPFRLGLAVASPAFLFALGIFATGFCGCGPSPGAPSRPGEGAGPVRLVVFLPGDGPVGERDLDLGKRIEERLTERGIGSFAGGGAGPGYFDLSYRTEDTGRARRAMEVVMAAEAPGRSYQVLTGPGALPARK